jgi:hypothetical protein
MPFTAGDAQRHTKKASTSRLRRMWSRIANSVRQRLLDEGMSESEADARAIRAANSRIGSGMLRRRK